MSYYDIDALLTDAQKLPCTFTLSVPGLGYLDASSASATINAGTTLHLPLWLSEMLAVSQRLGTTQNILALDLPSALSARVLNALRADPRSVELRGLATHYYGLAERVLGLFEDEEVCAVVETAFKTRAMEIRDLAVGGAVGETAAFLRGLDEEERNLFKVAHESAKAMRSYAAERAGRKG